MKNKKNKKGFTLAELLVVIVIIAVIAAIAVPSVILINKNINKRLYNSKVNMIISAAELYATDNPDIFNGTSKVKVYVYELINADYLKTETETGENCISSMDTYDTRGCIVDPINNNASMNGEYVILSKEAVGVTATFGGDLDGTPDAGGEKLVIVVCDAINSGRFTAKYGESTDTDEKKCFCKKNGEEIADPVALVDKDGNSVNACIITGQPDNYLSYGPDSLKGPNNTMWRVMGLYNITGTGVVAKMITDDNLNIQ